MAAPADRPQFDLQVKLLLIGDSGVGKTSLLLRYAADTFSPSFISTIGIDFKVKLVKIDDTMIKLSLWDTAGQERFRTITTSYFRGSHGILLVYDVNDRGSFDNVVNWIGTIDQHADLAVNKVLVANKCDSAKPAVTVAEGQALADQYGMKFFQTSAKANTGVTQVFETLTRDVKNRLLKEGMGGGLDRAKKVQPSPLVITKPVSKPGGGSSGCNGACAGGGASQ